MTDDERQARIIIQRWIHKKAGVSEFERGMRKIGDAFRGLSDKIEKALNPMQDTINKQDEEYGVVK